MAHIYKFLLVRFPVVFLSTVAIENYWYFLFRTPGIAMSLGECVYFSLWYFFTDSGSLSKPSFRYMQYLEQLYDEFIDLVSMFNPSRPALFFIHWIIL